MYMISHKLVAIDHPRHGMEFWLRPSDSKLTKILGSRGGI